MGKIELPPHLSFSSLSTYNTCGERFRLEKVERVQSVPGWALVGGNAVHAVTEQHDRALFGDDVQPQTFADAFEQITDEQIDRTGFTPDQWYTSGRASKAWPHKESREWWLHHGPIFVDAWLRWRDATPWNIWVVDDQPAIELELQPTFGGIPVKMFIDRIMVTPDGEMVVVDLKTGAKVPEPDQLGLYAAGVEQIMGPRPTYGAYWMSRTAGTGPVHALDGYTDARLGYEFSQGRAGMEAGLFPAKRSNLCGSCGVKRACYAVGGELAAQHSPFFLTSV